MPVPPLDEVVVEGLEENRGARRCRPSEISSRRKNFSSYIYSSSRSDQFYEDQNGRNRRTSPSRLPTRALEAPPRAALPRDAPSPR